MILFTLVTISIIYIILGPFKATTLALTLLLIYLHPFISIGILVMAAIIFYFFKNRRKKHGIQRYLSKLFTVISTGRCNTLIL